MYHHAQPRDLLGRTAERRRDVLHYLILAKGLQFDFRNGWASAPREFYLLVSVAGIGAEMRVAADLRILEAAVYFELLNEVSPRALRKFQRQCSSARDSPNDTRRRLVALLAGWPSTGLLLWLGEGEGRSGERRFVGVVRRNVLTIRNNDDHLEP